MEHAANWTLKRSARTRKLWIRVERDGSVSVTAPTYAPLAAIERFVHDRAEWITHAVRRVAKYKDDIILPRDRRSYLLHRENARGLVHELLSEYAPRYGFAYQRVSIKNLRRNWGSCSELGNLNFNYKLVLIPRHLATYVVVHELCHLKEFDHSADFWTLVAKEMPNFRALRKEMRRYHA